ncbi:MAG: response regulator transcription factor [Chitinophagaceae bacterium]|nr:response regulator transcription factor [Chitinophagaceae bacterium]
MHKIINILLAEDEISLGQIIKESLETQNMNVDFHINGETALLAYRKKKPDILILDIMMPVKDGLILAKDIRNNDSVTPIIFLTSKSQTKDVVAGFNVGCNDYIRKPFSIEELIVRIYALLGRSVKEVIITEVIQVGSYQFNANKQILATVDKSFSLTHKESSLLQMLVEHKNEVVNRAEILQKLWGNDDFFAGRSLDVFITKLRNKLKQDAGISIINVRGIGYKMAF